MLSFLFAPTFVSLARFFVKDHLDHFNGGEASRVSVAWGRRRSQARRFSTLKGLEVPLLLNCTRLLMGMKKVTWFFRHLGGVAPLLAPEGVSTMMGHSWYSLLTLKFRPAKKVNDSRERFLSFMHSFMRSWYKMYMGT